MEQKPKYELMDQGQIFLAVMGISFVILAIFNIWGYFDIDANLISIYSISGMCFSGADLFKAMMDDNRSKIYNIRNAIMYYVCMIFASFSFIILPIIYVNNKEDLSLLGNGSTLGSIGIMIFLVSMRNIIGSSKYVNRKNMSLSKNEVDIDS